MNEKIKELYWKCNKVQGDYSTGGTQVLDAEKFAELIIQECIKRIEGTSAPKIENMDSAQNYGYARWWEGYDDRGADNIEMIKKHFGVE